MYSCGPIHMDVQRQDDQLEPTYSSPVDLTEAMDDRKGWREKVRDIRADSMT